MCTGPHDYAEATHLFVSSRRAGAPVSSWNVVTPRGHAARAGAAAIVLYLLVKASTTCRAPCASVKLSGTTSPARDAPKADDCPPILARKPKHVNWRASGRAAQLRRCACSPCAWIHWTEIAPPTGSRQRKKRKGRGDVAHAPHMRGDTIRLKQLKQQLAYI